MTVSTGKCRPAPGAIGLESDGAGNRAVRHPGIREAGERHGGATRYVLSE